MRRPYYKKNVNQCFLFLFKGEFKKSEQWNIDVTVS